MQTLSCRTSSPDQRENLQRLVHSRWLVLACLAGLLVLLPGGLDIPLPALPLWGITLLLAIFNALTQWHIGQSDQATPYEMFSQLLLDIGALSGLVFFSGGAANPLISLLLPPVAIAALTLPARCVAIVAACAIGAYSLLMVYYIPLPLPDASRATRLHLLGMWLTFVVSTLMIGWFVVRMTRLIRERDAQLAAAREQALRDERILAMGTLAAGAAHELGTPLATMALLAGELAREDTLTPESRQDIELLRQQISQCKAIITGLSRRAGAERFENSTQQAVDRWLEQLGQHWQAIRPEVECRILRARSGPAPDIVADPRLEQALLNLLNNAAQARARQITLLVNWNAQGCTIDLCDDGPGFPPSVLAAAGRTPLPAHAGGSGVGLLLSRGAIEQLQGRFDLSNPEGGGAQVHIELPRTLLR